MGTNSRDTPSSAISWSSLTATTGSVVESPHLEKWKECFHNTSGLSMMAIHCDMNYYILFINTCFHEIMLKIFSRIHKHFRNDVINQCFIEENGDWSSKREERLAFYIISGQFNCLASRMFIDEYNVANIFLYNNVLKHQVYFQCKGNETDDEFK